MDARALRSNIEKWNKTGVAGFVALGSTGERVHLDEREHLHVIETAWASVPDNLAFIVGVGQQSTRATVSEVRQVGTAGANAVLVITPHFYRGAMTPSALINYYQTVADASPVPMVLYNIPQNTGIALTAETVARLSEHENIVGIKDSSGDMINLMEIISLVPDDFAVMTGSGPLLYTALCAGARGAILAVGCAVPQMVVAIYNAVKTGNYERARDVQRRLTPLARAMTRYGIGGLKAALDLRGYVGGDPRAPLVAANEEARQEIARLLAMFAPADGERRSDESDLVGAAP